MFSYRIQGAAAAVRRARYALERGDKGLAMVLLTRALSNVAAAAAHAAAAPYVARRFEAVARTWPAGPDLAADLRDMQIALERAALPPSSKGEVGE